MPVPLLRRWDNEVHREVAIKVIDLEDMCASTLPSGYFLPAFACAVFAPSLPTRRDGACGRVAVAEASASRASWCCASNLAVAPNSCACVGLEQRPNIIGAAHTFTTV